MHIIGRTTVAVGAIAAVLAFATAASAHHSTCRHIHAWGWGNDIGTAKYQSSEAVNRRAEVWASGYGANYSVSGKSYSCKRDASGAACRATAKACLKSW